MLSNSVITAPKKEAYIRWLALPEVLRPDDMKSREQFIEFMKVDELALYTWESEPGFWAEVYSLAGAVIGRELPEIMQAMVDKAKGGNVAATKLCMQMLGVFTEKTSTHVSFEDDQLVLVVGSMQQMKDEQQQQQPKQIEAGGEEEDSIALVGPE